MIQDFYKNSNKINGVEVSVTSCGLKKTGKDDLVLIKFSRKGKIFGCFTNSKTPGESIKWNKSIINNGIVSAILINSGNANVFNGIEGQKTQQNIIAALSSELNIDSKEIYIASTGVIGETLDEKKIINSLPKLIASLSNDNDAWNKAANAIRTTDTFPKLSSRLINIEKSKIHISGIAKGSGMIEPNMATMLAFIFTNANFKNVSLKRKIQKLVDKTFNSITVDGDKSTSDMMLFVSVNDKKKCYVSIEKVNHFLENLKNVMQDLAIQIVKDGEGSKKLIQINVTKAKNDSDAKILAKSIANSPLFKTAMAGNDSNWGRIIMAIGKTNIDINTRKICLKFGNIKILENGEKNKKLDQKKLKEYLCKPEIQILIDLGFGEGSSCVWTCDLTKEYISINADYRS